MADETVDKTEETAGAGNDATADATAEETAVTAAETPVAGDASELSEGDTAATEAQVASEATSVTAENVPDVREAMLIKPDVGFVKEIINGGGTDLKKCYQCATCSVVCNLTPDDSPFPRKEMMWAQWGLKDKLMGDPDVWLCHQCSDCVAQCPRGAKPGRVLQAIAKMTISRFSWPGILGKGVGSPAALVLMVAIPVLILLGVISQFGHLTNPSKGNIILDGSGHQIVQDVKTGGEIIYSNFIPIPAVDITFTLAFFFAILAFAVGSSRYWKLLSAHAVSEGGTLKGSGLGNLGPVLGEIITHKRFGKCDETEDRKVSHMFIFYAFLGLFVTTAISVIGEYLLHKHSPYGWNNAVPVKWIGSVSAAAGLIGIGWIMINRFKHAAKIGIGAYFDWLLISVVATVIVTGILAWGLRVANTPVAYTVYFIHLASVLFLFIYAPFSKMAHMVYRTVALVFARVTGRDMGIE
ncbi:MAG: quinone-interacting membrane-bound oxidoreductase complex subunit QmoC [Thermoleophilia bacterium]|jgi:quinone-modifying oxidoreductase subunit QmoC